MLCLGSCIPAKLLICAADSALEAGMLDAIKEHLAFSSVL